MRHLGLPRRQRWLLAGALVLIAAAPSAILRGADVNDRATVDVEPEVRDALQREGHASVIVELRLPTGRHIAEGFLSSPAAVELQRQDIGEAKSRVLDRLRTTDQKLVHHFETVPIVALVVGPGALAELEAAPQHVRRVVVDRPLFPALLESGPLVQAPLAAAHGFDGRGTVIAIIDYGVARGHPFFGGRVVEEACFSGGGFTSQSVCPNGLTAQVGSGAGVNCAFTGCDHGTHVAGIATGSGASAGVAFSGVARAAGVMAVQVSSKSGSVSTMDVMAGLGRVFALRNVYRFGAVNMSLGDSTGHTTFCDTDPLKPFIDNLRSVGIPTVVAAGNNGFANGLSAPACISSAISVGATRKNDTVPTFSNSASFLSLFAPGEMIRSSVPAVSFEFKDGTSMAAPHVAGAFAVLRQAAPTASVTQLLTALQNTGVLVTDVLAVPRVTRPRIRIAAAVSAVAALRLDVLHTDFTGDGRIDVVVQDRQSGNWFVGRSTGNSFVIESWVSRFGNRGAVIERALVADFTGDGKADIAIHDRQTGNWFVGRSTGGGFLIEPWATHFGDRGDTRERAYAADFTGDSKADIAIHNRQTGDWFVGRSTGTSFTVEAWVSGFGNRGDDAEEVFVADFTGDGLADIAIHNRQTGDWFVGRSTGSSFVIEQWARGFGNHPTAEEVLIGDFDGDGRADVAIRDRNSGNWFVGRSTGSEFSVTQWASNFGNQGAAREAAFVADFTGDGRADVVIHDRQTGNWFVGRSTGSAFAVESWTSRFGNRGEAAEEVFVGDFTGDGLDDVAVHDRGTGNWFVGRSTGSSFVLESWVTRFGNRGEAIEGVFGGHRR